MSITYIICAAGDGTRTKTINKNTPKPLLHLDGLSLLEWSIKSLDLYKNDQVVIVTKPNSGYKDVLKKLTAQHPQVEITHFTIEKTTRGQLETALLTKSLWKNEKLAIFNADTYFRSSKLTTLMNDESIQGIIPCSQQTGDNWSFCKPAEGEKSSEFKVSEVTEKKRISDWCSVGFYYFSSHKLFLSAAQIEADRIGTTAELYVAPAYNHLIKDGKMVLSCDSEIFLPMGSVEQFSEYWKKSLEDLRNENPMGTLIVDLDNTITIDSSSSDYSNKAPNTEVIAKLKEMKSLGYKIIIHTSRRMKTHKNNEAFAIADIGLVTLTWLQKHEVPFDGIRFGKPFAENGFYIDDKNLSIEEFLNTAF